MFREKVFEIVLLSIEDERFEASIRYQGIIQKQS